MGIEIRADPGADEVAAFLGIGSDELADRDRFQRPVGRWLAADGRNSVGLATAFVRPDDRLFVTHRLRSETAFEPLLDAAVDSLDRPIHLSIANDRSDRLRLAEQRGFTTELSSLVFDVPFRPALAMTAGHHSARIQIVGADRVSPDALFTLDTDLRQDVPGSDGWQGDRAWFDEELASPEFDPAAFLVARDRATSDLVGLCRIWKNDGGPKLGLVGVRRSHRTGRPALALLHQSLLGASRWGFDTFSTHTARPPLQRRLLAIGAERVGGFTQLRRDGF